MDSGFQLAMAQAQGYEAWSGQFMSPSARLLADAASLSHGDRVLDLACGTGLVARFASEAVGSDGAVIGVDVNPGMLAAADAGGPDGIEWIESPAESLPFADADFERVLCQQGVQFFADAAAAFVQVRRVLRPAGEFLATVWAAPNRNPYIDTQLELLTRVAPGSATTAAAAVPDHADDLLADLAKAAGFSEISIVLLEHTVEVADLGEFFLKQTGTTPWAGALAGMSDEGRRRLAEELVERLGGFAVGDIHNLPFASHLLRARVAA